MFNPIERTKNVYIKRIYQRGGWKLVKKVLGCSKSYTSKLIGSDMVPAHWEMAARDWWQQKGLDASPVTNADKPHLAEKPEPNEADFGTLGMEHDIRPFKLVDVEPRVAHTINGKIGPAWVSITPAGHNAAHLIIGARVIDKTALRDANSLFDSRDLDRLIRELQLVRKALK